MFRKLFDLFRKRASKVQPVAPAPREQGRPLTTTVRYLNHEGFRREAAMFKTRAIDNVKRRRRKLIGRAKSCNPHP